MVSWPGEDPPVKILSFSSHCRKSHKSIDLVLFIVRVQFSVIRHKKSNTEAPHSSKSRRPRRDVLEKVQEEKGIQRIHRPQRVAITRLWSHQKALENMFLQAQRTFLTASYIRYSSVSNQTRAAKRSLTLMLLKASLHLLKP